MAEVEIFTRSFEWFCSCFFAASTIYRWRMGDVGPGLGGRDNDADDVLVANGRKLLLVEGLHS